MKIKRHYMTLLELLVGMALTMLLLTTITFFYQEIDHLNTNSERMQKQTFQLEYLENRLSTVIPKILSGTTNNPPIFFTSNDLNGLLAANSPSLVFTYETGADLDDKRAVDALGRLFLDKQNRLSLATWPDPDDWEESNLPSGHLEVLLENVEAITFSFYVAPDRDRSLVDLKKKNQDLIKKPEPQPKVPEKKTENKKKEWLKKAGPAKESDPEEKKKEEEPAKEPEPKEQAADMENAEPEPKGQWISEWKREFKQIPSMLKIQILQRNKEGEEVKSVFAFPLLKSKNVIVYE